MIDFKIGTQIRKLRTIQKRTLQEIADACELSKSMVSKIETNAVVPSVSTLVKIAKALGVKVSVLMEQEQSPNTVIVRAEKANTNQTKTDKGYSFFPFASEFKDKKMQPFLFVANKGEVKEHHLSHEGQEFIYILEGELKIHIGTTDYTLQQGDSVYFEALELHGIMPISEQVKYINIFV